MVRPWSGRIQIFVLSLVALLVTACAGPATPAAPASQPAGQPAGQQTAPRQTKTLRIGTTREPVQGITVFRGTGSGDMNPHVTFHSALTVNDQTGALLPRLAESVPTIEAGDWVVDPDGKMRLTWKLKPNVKWHDGAPLSVDDFLLGLRIMSDPEIAIARTTWASGVDSIEKVDDRTMVVTWKRPYFLANVGGPDEITPVPHHILAEPYESGMRANLDSHPYWTREFVGLGPYRISNWAPGSTMEALAYDAYFAGRPKIDRLQFRFITDTNALVATLLAGEIDYIPIGSLKVDQLAQLKDQWETPGVGSFIRSSDGLRTLLLQYRDTSMPWVTDYRVRQALVETLDRQSLVDTLQHGQTTIGHTVPTPDDPLYALVEQRGLKKYTYDPRHAQELLGQAGWNKGGDGRYRNAAGNPFPFEIRTVVTAPETQQQIVAMADLYKAAGFDSTPFGIPNTVVGVARSEQRAKAPGAFDNSLRDDPESLSDFLSNQIATEANGWRGRNVWGYSDAAWDQTYLRYQETLTLAPRQAILADLLKRAADELIFLPMYYYPGTTNQAVRKGLTGPTGVKSVFRSDAWNIETWDLN
jgi:peptide/nickel transport system substrate-binding protein